MRGGRLIVVDWTRGAALAGVFAEGAGGWRLESELCVPSRLAVRRGAEEGVRVLACTEAADAREDADTLVFEQPAQDLSRIEDAELQTLLASGFWRALERELVARGALREGARAAAGYVVVPHHFPLPLLENFRAACAGEDRLKLVGFVHEAAALVLGLLRSESSRPDEGAASDSATTCLVTAYDEQTVDVACFDQERTSRAVTRVLVRDFFRTTCATLSARLHDCDWLGAFTHLAVVEDPSLPEHARAALEAPLRAVADGVAYRRRQTSGATKLKLDGGAYVALCAAGRAPDPQEYDIAHACHIGVQTDQEHFRPVIHKDDWARLSEFPHVAAQAFRLRGQPASALRVNFYGGYSTRVADAVPLGHTTLGREELSRVEAAASLTAAVCLDAPCGGEFLLGLLPDNRVLRRQPFTLPGLVI